MVDTISEVLLIGNQKLKRLFNLWGNSYRRNYDYYWKILKIEYLTCFRKFRCKFCCFKKTCQIFNFQHFLIILVPAIIITWHIKMMFEFLVSDKQNFRNSVNREGAFFRDEWLNSVIDSNWAMISDWKNFDILLKW